MKRKIMILFALGCMTVLGAGAVTYAYLTDDDVKQNEIRAAENKVHIEEEFEPPEDPQPGDVIVKKPWVVNDSKIPVYVRIRVCFSDSRGESQCEPLQIHRKWSLQEDGYYYYENVLAAGEKTEPLFESIQLKLSRLTDLQMQRLHLLHLMEEKNEEKYKSYRAAFGNCLHFRGALSGDRCLSDR